MSDQIVEQMRPLIEKDLIKVRRTEFWLEVEINTNILFPSGSKELNSQAGIILHRLAEILKPFPNPIRVEGFTDNVPINTREFASNWELSAGRAARVVRLFAEVGVEPTRMAAVGFGEFRPVTDNTTLVGRSKNRRVALVVLAGADSRYQMDVARDITEVKLDAPPQDAGGGGQ
jgi:chemotaxis protein MotB